VEPCLYENKKIKYNNKKTGFLLEFIPDLFRGQG
jgi:hypothetical protein